MRRRRCETTLDLDLNRFVEGAVRDQLARLRAKNVHDAAAVVIDNATGDVLALVGSENYFAPGTGQVNGAWAPRSAGSTFKPFTYLLALERGATPATIVADVPATFPTPTGSFRPENYNRRCYGPVRYRLALANSLNIPAVRVLASHRRRGAAPGSPARVGNDDAGAIRRSITGSGSRSGMRRRGCSNWRMPMRRWRGWENGGRIGWWTCTGGAERSTPNVQHSNVQRRRRWRLG